MTNPTFGVTIVKTAAAWGAVASMALCVAVLIASEFMPVSLLTPIARDLGMSEGQAGQAISISGLFAVLTSLFIAVHAEDRPQVRPVLVLAHADRLGARRILRPQLHGSDGRSGAARRCHRRILVDVHRGRHAPPAGECGAGGPCVAECRQRYRCHDSPLRSAAFWDYIGWRGAFFFVVPLALIARRGS